MRIAVAESGNPNHCGLRMVTRFAAMSSPEPI